MQLFKCTRSKEATMSLSSTLHFREITNIIANMRRIMIDKESCANNCLFRERFLSSNGCLSGPKRESYQRPLPGDVAVGTIPYVTTSLTINSYYDQAGTGDLKDDVACLASTNINFKHPFNPVTDATGHIRSSLIESLQTFIINESKLMLGHLIRNLFPMLA